MSAREAEARVLDFLRVSSAMKTSLHAETRDVIAAVASAEGEATVRASDLEAILAEASRLRALEARAVLVTASYRVSAMEGELFRGEDLRDRIMRGLVDNAMLEVLKHARFKTDDGPRGSVLHRAEITVISNASGAPEMIA